MLIKYVECNDKFCHNLKKNYIILKFSILFHFFFIFLKYISAYCRLGYLKIVDTNVLGDAWIWHTGLRTNF